MDSSVASEDTATVAARQSTVLMQRVFAIDVLECPSCGARMRIHAAIHALGAIRAILECAALSGRRTPSDHGQGLSFGRSLPSLS